jgi:response regulator of citrate/malate metabolism
MATANLSSYPRASGSIPVGVVEKVTAQGNQRVRDRPWQILIVEDDPIVASVYKRSLEGSEDFEVRGVVCSGEDALAFLGRWPCDLMLLDLQLAGMNGVTLLQRLRAANDPIEVIAVTATRAANVVRAILQRGALEYLVKPFEIERLHRALDLFRTRVTALDGRELDQGTIDVACAAGRVSRRRLPKGLTEQGVRRIKKALIDDGGSISSVEVAELTGIARETARRYLEYLVTTNQASVSSEPSGPGRPRNRYTSPESGADLVNPSPVQMAVSKSRQGNGSRTKRGGK